MRDTVFKDNKDKLHVGLLKQGSWLELCDPIMLLLINEIKDLINE